MQITHIKILGLEKRRMSNDGRVNDVVKRKIEHETGYTGHKWT